MYDKNQPIKTDRVITNGFEKWKIGIIKRYNGNFTKFAFSCHDVRNNGLCINGWWNDIEQPIEKISDSVVIDDGCDHGYNNTDDMYNDQKNCDC